MTNSTDDLKNRALFYHSSEPRGKLEISPTKPLATQVDLALAYSPGVAHACQAIIDDPNLAAQLTGRGNTVAVITNGTAVLGLGSIGPLASKPVMEGKAVLFKKFGNINSIDIEISATDVDQFCTIVSSLEPSFGGINLEDISAPECFFIEQNLRKKMNIPVFHDDQHGTAIVVSAGMLNALKLTKKKLKDVQLVCSGAGAAAIACLDMLVGLGLSKNNIIVTDRDGVITAKRGKNNDMFKSKYAREIDIESLEQAIINADIFLGLSAPNIVNEKMLSTMADKPIVFALANPIPEVMPELVKSVRPDALIATGRSDYPNQINNVLCFPFLFRGALDCGATIINEEMKKACALALANMVNNPPTHEVIAAYKEEQLVFGPEYLIPKPFDPRLILEIPPAVVLAAQETGVAQRPITNIDSYREKLSTFVFQSGMFMKPVFEAAKRHKKHLVLAEGEGGKMLQTCQLIISEDLAKVTLVGRPHAIKQKIDSMGLSIRPGLDFEIIDNLDERKMTSLGIDYHLVCARQGITPKVAQTQVRANTTAVAAMLLKNKEADAMLCGTFGTFEDHLDIVKNIIGLDPYSKTIIGLTALILPQGTLFIADTHVNKEPDSETLCEIARLSVLEIKKFGIVPKVAFLSHSNFGSSKTKSSSCVRNAVDMFKKIYPTIEADGEMQADAALNEKIRNDLLPNSPLSGIANLLVCPNLDSANISRNLLKTLGGGVTVGPIILGLSQEAHVSTGSNTPRGLLNLAAIALGNINRGDT